VNWPPIPNYRSIRADGLIFGFKIILQKKAKEHRQHFFVAGIHSPFI
jgi:hypothetical protein